MLDQSLLQSHFIGRDGFRWWIGQIPTIDAWGEQANGDGWGLRYKVRILGYHPLDDKELENKDLPWAQVILPTTAGSGAANYAVNPKIRPGDIVIGFFLDGDNAQIPVIMGLLGRTKLYSDGNYKSPFVSFTGYTDNIPNPKSSGRNYPNQTNEATATAQQNPRQVPPEVAKRLNEIADFTGRGKDVVFADTCENTTIKSIKAEVNNLLKQIQDAQGKISEYQQSIRNTAEVIKSYLNWLVGEMQNAIFNFLVGNEKEPGIIPKALKAIHIDVYAKTLAATGSPAAAQTAAYKSNEVFVEPIKALETAISCVTNAVVEGLKELIIQLLESLLENVQNFVTCAAEQFVGALVSGVIDSIADGLTSALDGVSGLLSGAFSVVEFLSKTADVLNGLNNITDCNQSNTKCDGTKEWKIGIGPKNSFDPAQSFNNILDIANTLGSMKTLPQDTLSQLMSSAETIGGVFSDETVQDILSAVGTCFTGFPTSCGAPKMNIFGGGGIGGAAVPILGSVIQGTSVYNNVTETCSVIGAIVTNPGSGYRFPPFIEIVDDCGLGYGAKARASIDSNGQISSIYVTSAGEGYPYLPDDQEPYGVVNVAVQSAGQNYSSSDTATDNLGNSYNLTVDNGVILSATPLNTIKATSLPIITVNSDTGFGAVLKPILGPLKQTAEIQKQVDCPI